jgi:hypothetical protein
MAPVEDLEKALAEGGKIDVQKKSGDWSSFVVASLGKPFDVDGVQMCYGYGPEDGDGESSDDSGGRRQSPPRSSAQRPSDAPRRPARQAPAVDAPPVDPTEPLPEYQGGPHDEWDGYF